MEGEVHPGPETQDHQRAPGIKIESQSGTVCHGLNYLSYGNQKFCIAGGCRKLENDSAMSRFNHKETLVGCAEPPSSIDLPRP
jgi:hypothetical protein